MPLLRSEITDGPREGFKSVEITGADGSKEYLTIEERFLAERDGELFLPVLEIGRDKPRKNSLVQLPMEADSGARRVWVDHASLVFDTDLAPA